MECILCNSSAVKVENKFEQKKLRETWLNFYDIDKICKDEFVFLYKCQDCGLEFFDPKFAGTDEFYSELGKLEWYYEHPGKTEYDFVQKYFNDGVKVLDIGCGIAVLEKKTKAKINYTGLELSSYASKVANDRGVNVINQTIQEFSKENEEAFDIVVSFQVLEHLTEIPTFIESALKVLKKGGKFVIAVPNNESFISRIPNYKFNLPPHHTILWKRKQLLHLAELFNIEIKCIQNEEIQDVHLESAQNAARFWLVGKLYSYNNQVIDFSEKYYKILKKVEFLNKMIPKRITNFLLRSKWKDGQSVICVFEKK